MLFTSADSDGLSFEVFSSFTASSAPIPAMIVIKIISHPASVVVGNAYCRNGVCKPYNNIKLTLTKPSWMLRLAPDSRLMITNKLRTNLACE